MAENAQEQIEKLDQSLAQKKVEDLLERINILNKSEELLDSLPETEESHLNGRIFLLEKVEHHQRIVSGLLEIISKDNAKFKN